MKAIQGYNLIKPEDLFWRPSDLMNIPNADSLERTGSENIVVRLWRLPPRRANTLHKHLRAEPAPFGEHREAASTLVSPAEGKADSDARKPPTPMSNQNTHLLKLWFEEVWNKGREEAIDELATTDIVSHGLVDARGQQISGREKFHEFWRNFREAFPDIQVTVEDALSDGDKEMVRCTVYATHRGHGIGVAATQKPVKFTGMVIARIEDGRLAEAWDSWDFLGLYQQLGAVPASIV